MLATIPQSEADALAEADWYFLGMGKHVIEYNYKHNQDCNSVMPICLFIEIP